jgi:hypothetical protein
MQQVVYMAPANRASLQKYNGCIAIVVQENDNELVLQFANGLRLANVPTTQVRFLK